MADCQKQSGGISSVGVHRHLPDIVLSNVSSRLSELARRGMVYSKQGFDGKSARVRLMFYTDLAVYNLLPSLKTVKPFPAPDNFLDSIYSTPLPAGASNGHDASQEAEAPAAAGRIPSSNRKRPSIGQRAWQFISENPGLTVDELSERYLPGVPKPSLTAQLSTLKKKGFIYSKRCRDQVSSRTTRRLYLCEPTQAAKPVVTPVAEGGKQAIIKPFSIKEIALALGQGSSLADVEVIFQTLNLKDSRSLYDELSRIFDGSAQSVASSDVDNLLAVIGTPFGLALHKRLS